MTWVNYDDVQRQLVDAGLILQGGIEINTPKPVRCLVEGGGRERRGWYWLNDILLDHAAPDGVVMKLLYIVGAYGVYRGNDSGKTKVELPKAASAALTVDQRTAIKARQDENIKRMAAAQRAAADRAARRAQRMWSKCATEGESGYLTRKQVQAHAVRFTPGGALVVPMCDATGKIHGLQFILDRSNKKHARRIAQVGRDKEYWPKQLVKQGHYCLLGGLPVSVVLIAEGYATAASLYAATGLPVAVAFDAGNLLPVAQALRKRYARAHILLCADDDYLTKCHALADGKKCGTYSLAIAGVCRSCGTPLPAGNAGITQASTAALAVRGEWLAPCFTAPRPVDTKGATDFNDLHVTEGLHLVRAQVEEKMDALGWRVNTEARAAATAEGAGAKLKSLLSIDEACERYTLIYGGGGALFDHQEHMLVPKSDVLDILPDSGWRTWKERAGERKIAKIDQVGFDPTNTDKNLRCNLWGGWPTTPKAGGCDNLLDLLRYLCAHEENADQINDWVLKWLAYPIQHPGAKMKSALVFHGPQGVGKNMFFEAIMAIYGKYGRIVDQHAIEDKFNDWASCKLFLVADEVVARAELFHTKNKLKAFITGDWIRINPKNMAAHEERNHVNIVFLSNETQPLVLERDDRRYCVIWTPGKLPRDVYQDVNNEILAGGIAALHHYLLHLDLGDFKPWSEPPMTRAKTELIDFSMDSVDLFIHEWRSGESGFRFIPCLPMDLYGAYARWCKKNGESWPRNKKEFLGKIKKLAGWTSEPRLLFENASHVGERHGKRIIIQPPEEIAAAPANNERDTPSWYRGQPTNLNQSQWLTDCYLEFRASFGVEE